MKTSLVPIVLLTACVSPVRTADAPCPCAGGDICCEATQLCVSSVEQCSHGEEFAGELAAPQSLAFNLSRDVLEWSWQPVVGASAYEVTVQRIPPFISTQEAPWTSVVTETAFELQADTSAPCTTFRVSVAALHGDKRSPPTQITQLYKPTSRSCFEVAWTNPGRISRLAVSHGRFIAAASDGVLRESELGGKINLDLTQRFTGGVTSMAVSPNRVLVTTPFNNGTALWRSDDRGDTWSTQPVLHTGYSSIVAYGAGRYVAVSAYDTFTVELPVYVSTDEGQTWTEKNVGTGLSALTWLVFGGETFVGVSREGAVFTSHDGLTWVQRPSLSQSLVDVTFTNGSFHAFSQLTHFVSTDGAAWTSFVMSGAPVGSGVASNGGSWVAISTSGTGMLRSNDGTTWTEVPVPTSAPLRGTVYARDTFYAFGDGRTLLSSQQGESWTHELGRGVIQALSADAVRAVGVGNNGTIVQSLDQGVTWTDHDIDRAEALVDVKGDLVIGRSSVWRTQDFTTWQRVYHDTVDLQLKRLVRCGNAAVAVGDSIAYLRIDNGMVQASSLPRPVSTAVCHDNTFVLYSAAEGHWVLTSTDGLSWTESAFAAEIPTSLASVGTTLYGGWNGGIWRSSNGLDTTPIPIADLPPPRSVHALGSSIHVAFDATTFAESQDSMTWTKHFYGPLLEPVTLTAASGVTFALQPGGHIVVLR